MVNTVIKIKQGGCGIKYTDANGVSRHMLMQPENGPFECDIEQAKRLVELGVAECVPPWTLGPEGDAPAEDKQQESQAPEKRTGHLDAADLELMTCAELKKLAADMGITPEGTKKADYIAALVDVEIEYDAEEDEADELPDLCAADPE